LYRIIKAHLIGFASCVMERCFYKKVLLCSVAWPASIEDVERHPLVRNALSRRPKLDYQFSEYNCCAVFVGPRQVGKTTCFLLLIRDLLARGKNPDEIAYISCERVADGEHLYKVVESWGERGVEYAFFDEVTFVRGWERAVKHLLDTGRMPFKSFFLTGSTSAFLKYETFPGRPIRLVAFFPLDFRRFSLLFGSRELRRVLAKHKGLAEKSIKAMEPHLTELNTLLDKYLICGGFPRPMFELFESGTISIDAYDAVLRWVRGDVEKLRESFSVAIVVIQELLLGYGHRLTLSGIAKRSEVLRRPDTVNRYLDLLSRVMLLYRYYQRAGRRRFYGKAFKVHFVDPFVIHVFERLLFNETLVEDSLLVQGIVGEHLRRKYGQVFYQLINGLELDFVVGRDYAVEVKWREHVDPKRYQTATKQFEKVYLLTREEASLKKRIKVIPISIFLALLDIPLYIPFKNLEGESPCNAQDYYRLVA